jgi:hypothetical protein
MPGYPAGPGTGVLAFLLPYVEQDNVYKNIPSDMFNYNSTMGDWAYNTAPYDYQLPGQIFVNGTGYIPAATARIKTFECPSDNAGDLTTVTGGFWTEYMMPPGNTADYSEIVKGLPRVGVSNYVANPGAYLDFDTKASTKYVGPFGMNTKNKLTDITDGTSNTLAFGETLGGQDHGARDFYPSWMGATGLSTAWGIPAGGQAGWWNYSSRHTGVVLFSFCDGSVHALTKGITSGAAYNTFIAMSGMNESNVVDTGSLGF